MIVTLGAEVYPEPGFTTLTAVTTPLASIVAVPVACTPLTRFGRPNTTVGWVA